MSYERQIKDILLNHYGRNNKITSGEIANILGVDEDDTHAGTRALILQSAKKYELPLAADSTGYYLIGDEFEYNRYMENLDARISGIQERKNIITKNYKKSKEK